MQELDLSAFFTTKSQATDFTSRVANLSERMYQTDFVLEKSIRDLFGLQKADTFSVLMREMQVNSQSKADLKLFFTKLLDYTNKLPVLTLTLAFEPNDQSLKILSDWFIMNLKKQVLFDIAIDKNLLAGVAMTYKGKYVNFSIRPQAMQLIESIVAKLTQPQTQHVPMQKTVPAPNPIPQTIQNQHTQMHTAAQSA